MPKVVLVASQKYITDSKEAVDLEKWLIKQGHQTLVKILPDISSGELEPEKDLNLSGVDLAVSLGGDGAILHAVELVSDAGIPVLGVNYGQMGYLAEVESKNIKTAITSFFKGKYEIEERMRLSATHITKGSSTQESKKLNALNEIFLGKIHSGHTIRLELSINGNTFLTYEADGMIISTPTGSTAYSLSAGGPILEPGLEAMVLTPVAPHMIFDRSFVLSPESEFQIDVLGGYSAEFSMDGLSLGEIKPEESVVIKKAEQPARLVTLKERDFHKVLKSKFGLQDR